MGSSSNTVGSVFDSSVQADADGNVEVEGDLTVKGTTTSIETVNLKVEDKLIELGNGVTGTPSGDGGIILERGDSANAAIIWDESADTWVISTTSATGSSSGDLTLTDAALKAAAITASGDITTTGDIIIDDGGSLKEAGGTAAFTFDGSGNVTKIGQDSPISGQFLKYDGAKWVADAVTGNVAGSVAADDISAGDAAINLTTTAGNITIDAQGSDTDIIFKGTDGSSDTTFLTLDGSAAGAASFNSTVTATGFIIGSADINENDLEAIDGVTAGTVAASKAVVVDTNKDITGFRNVTLTGELDAGSLDISGNADIDGTLEADAITVGGTALNTVIAGVTVTNATNATTAANITVADESSDTTCFPIFATGASGDLAPKSGSNLTFNSSNGTLSATEFSGGGSAITGLDGSNIGSGTVNAARMAAAQTAITSVVNTSLEIGRDADNRIKFGTDNQIIFEVDGGDNVIFKTGGEIEATSLDISGDVDVDGTLEADAITVNGSALAASATTDTTNASNIGSGTVNAARMAAAQTAIESVLNTSLVVGRDADNQLKFGTDNEITFRVSGNDGVVMKASGEIEATSLDISGDVDVDGTLEADAITVNGAALAASATTDTTNAANIGSGTLAAARMAADQTGIGSIKNTALVVGRDNDNLIDFATDNEIKLRVNGADLVSITGGSSLPNVSATATSGTNQDGKSITLGGGLGTGTGVPGSVEIASGIPTSSGSNAHTATPVAIFDTFGVTSNFGGVANLVNDTGVGEVVFFGTEDSGQNAQTLAAGRLVYLDSNGIWKYADADAEVSTNSLIGIALGDAVNVGILLKGFFKLNSYIEGSFAKGAPCFVSENAGSVDFVKPSAVGDHVRILGYGTDTTNVIYFNPSSTTLTL